MNKDWIKLANDPNFGLFNLFSLERHGKAESEKCSQEEGVKEEGVKRVNKVKIDFCHDPSFQDPISQKGQKGQNPQLETKTGTSPVAPTLETSRLKRHQPE